VRDIANFAARSTPNSRVISYSLESAPING
jgi:hypothetical protein